MLKRDSFKYSPTLRKMTEIDGAQTAFVQKVEESEMKSFRPQGSRAAASTTDNHGFVSWMCTRTSKGKKTKQ